MSGGGVIATKVPHLTSKDFARFWAKVQKTDTCWVWTGTRQQKGYGRFSLAGKMIVAHRVAYVSLVGPIPDGLVLDRLCRNTSCVNPAHLEAVTGRVNTLRGIGPAARHAAATHCPQGHEYDETNTKIGVPGDRRCRTCIREQSKRRPRWDCEQCGVNIQLRSRPKHLRKHEKANRPRCGRCRTRNVIKAGDGVVCQRDACGYTTRALLPAPSEGGQ